MQCLLTLICFVTGVRALKLQPHQDASTPALLPTGMIKLHPPANVTAGYVGLYNIYIYWYEPENYHLRIPLFMNITQQDITTAKGNRQQDMAKTGDVNNKHIWPNMTYHVVSRKPDEVTSQPTGETTTPPKLSWIGHSLVPFHEAHLLKYIVQWKEIDTDRNQTIFVEKNNTEYHLQNLNPGMTYVISVTAQYKSGTFLKSEDLNITTLESPNGTTTPGRKVDCYCDLFGTKENGKVCDTVKMYPNLIIPRCSCKEGHIGMFCERCAPKYFRTGKRLPCYKCPCDEKVSTGECDFVEDVLTCSRCNLGYGGKHCERCHQGYWRHTSKDPCKPCQCRGRSKLCDPISGHCIGCSGNTTGYSCERCADDYIGDPLKNQPCVHKDRIKVTSAHTGGIVAGICIGLLVLVAGIVGFICYKKWNRFPSGKKFWTVELRDDHEKVNFSALPEDEIQARRMDYDFYQDQGGSRGRDGSQKYSHLQEI